jgi:hypothetical protein
MRNKGYMNSAYQVSSNISVEDYDSICDQFNLRAG